MNSPATVLVVDDLRAVRSFAVTLLRRAGYHVLEAGTAADALRAAELADDLHLVVVDVGLPDGSGADLALALTAFRPGLKVLVTSGDAEPPADDGLPPGAAFLPKPFTPASLAAVARALGEPLPI